MYCTRALLTRVTTLRPRYGHVNYVQSVARYATTPLSLRNPGKVSRHDSTYTKDEIANQVANANLLRLAEAYRRYGHYKAQLDPLAPPRPDTFRLPQLDLANFGFSEADLSKSFNLKGIVNLGKDSASLSDIIAQLEKSYCSKIGAQFTHVESDTERKWLYENAEKMSNQQLTNEEKLKALDLISKSETFDHFMGKRFPGTKRYGLEGNETMMPIMDEIFSKVNQAGVTDVVVGMPHRGRLNLLTGLLKYAPRHIFWKCQGNSEIAPGVLAIGDVLSHIGTSVNLDQYSDKPLHVSLIQNPSHLEAANPVAMGKVRAKQDNSGDTARSKAACVLLHGDAAFAGQGVVAESLGLAELPGFTVGGTVHLIVNNQVGFTATSTQGRSSLYSADLAKMIGAPILIVNSDSVEDAIKATRLAVEYRNKFKKDVIIDLIGYRRHGHNELDEPSFTQPLMYQIVRPRASVAKQYKQKLVEEGLITDQAATEISEKEYEYLDQEIGKTKSYEYPPTEHLQGKWAGFVQSPDVGPIPDTGVAIEKLKEIGVKSVAHPNTTIHPRLEKLHCAVRVDKLNKNVSVDWATAESLAFGSLLTEGYNIRFCGQDVGRGTFSHRHLELVDQTNENVFVPLNNLQEGQGKLELVNSVLSELSVLAYEYGYSIEDPKTLPIWEAQFGDFSNCAQVTIDQFVTSGESKWLRQSGLTIMLPHGYDGAGPEHSSARIERYLQLSDVEGVEVYKKEAFTHNPNFFVVVPTTPANYFHALRRQMARKYRKPLVIFGPKVLIRLAAAVSPLKDMQVGTRFESVLYDTEQVNPENVERVMFCSGQVYYSLLEERKKTDMFNTAFVRLEELSPFPFERIEEVMRFYRNAKKYYWVQEESQNAGAWSYVEPRFKHFMEQAQTTLKYVGRPPLSASAIGVSAWHKKEGATLLKDAFSK